MFDLIYEQNQSQTNEIGEAPEGCITISIGAVLCLDLIVGTAQP